MTKATAPELAPGLGFDNRADRMELTMKRFRQGLVEIGRAIFSAPADEPMQVPAVSPDSRAQIVGLVVVLLAFTAAAIYAARIELGFSADGAHYFASMLDSGSFFYTGAWSRVYSQFAMQWPLVLALKAGIEDVPLLAGIFHFGLYLPFLLSLALCGYALRGTGNLNLLFFPLASYVLVPLTAISIWSGEGQFLAVLVWPILFLLLRPRLTLVDGLVLIALLLLMSRTKETSAASALVFIGMLGLRLLVDRSTPRSLLLFAMGTAVLSIVIGAYWTLFPASVSNRASFMYGIIAPFQHPMFLCALAAMSLLLLSAGFERLRWLAWPAVLIAAVSVSLPAFGYELEASSSFRSRTLTLTLLPVLLCCAILFHWKRPVIRPRGWLLGYGTICLLVLGHVVSWASWSDFRANFKDVLHQNTGYVAVEDTAVANSRQRWSWTAPTLSLLWSGACVQTIILNRAGGTSWEPFDPHTKLPLQKFVAFDAVFSKAAQQAERCN